MALIWADNFEMYGTIADTLSGVYAEATNRTDLVNFAGTKALVVGGAAESQGLRFVLPSFTVKGGVGAFWYLPSLPVQTSGLGRQTPGVTLRNGSNQSLFSMWVSTIGELVISRGEGSAGEEVVRTSSPVLTAEASTHVEWWADFSIEGMVSFEVRVRGRTVIEISDVSTTDAGYSQVFLGVMSSGASSLDRVRYTHVTFADGLGAVNNDFLGQVMVYWNKPISTLEEGGWVSSAEASVSETLSKPLLANQLTSSGGIVNSDTVRIQNIYYRWTSSAPTAGAGTLANPWLVALGADSAESLKNMYEAINASGIPGTTYSPNLVEHPLVKGFGLIADAFCVVPKVEGTTTMTFSETGAALVWASTNTFLERVWDPIRMSAGYTPAVKATGSLTFSGNPTDGDSVAVGGTTFTFKISPSNPTDVLIGGTPETTAVNLASKISANLSTVVAEASSLQVDLTAVSAGALGNTISLASTSAVITTSDSTLEGGEDITYPDPFEVGLTPLSDDVTSIRAVIPVVRAAKLDGGDGNIQVSFGTLNTNYDVGPDTPITNAMTYWGNATDPFVSEINPDTGTPWTPGEFNLGARIRVARTK